MDILLNILVFHEFCHTLRCGKQITTDHIFFTSTSTSAFFSSFSFKVYRIDMDSKGKAKNG